MRVVCAYTNLHPLADAALTAYAPTAECHCLDVDDFDAYHAFLRQTWEEGEGFLNIEHDIEIHESVVSEMSNCPEDWCVWPYIAGGLTADDAGDCLLYSGLGCTKFSTNLLRKRPHLMADLPERSWRRLDGYMLTALLDLGYERHYHMLPPIAHHHAPEQ